MQLKLVNKSIQKACSRKVYFYIDFDGVGLISTKEQVIEYMRSDTCTNLKFSTNLYVPFLIYVVSSSTDLTTNTQSEN